MTRPLFVRTLLGASRRAVQHPRMTLSMAAFVAVLGVVGAMRLRPTGSLTALLADDDPAVAALSRIANEFAAVDDLVLVVTPTDSEASSVGSRVDQLRVFAEELEKAIRDNASVSAKCVAVTYHDQPAVHRFIRSELIPSGLFYLDAEALARLLNRLSGDRIREQIRTNAELISTPGPAGQAIAKRILRDPLRLHEELRGAFGQSTGSAEVTAKPSLLLSRDRQSLMVRITGASPASDLDFTRGLMRDIRSLVDRHNPTGHRVGYTGSYAIAATAERAIRGDMKRSIIYSVVLLSLLFLVVYRHWMCLPLVLAPVALGILAAFGASSLYTTKLTPIVAVIGAVLAGLGVDYCVHFLSKYRADRSIGRGHQECLDSAFSDVGPAMMAACATSVFGFLSISFSTVPALRHFALLGALGLTFSLVAALTVLPCLIRACAKDPKTSGEPRLLRSTFVPLLDLLSRHAKSVVLLACIVMTVSAAFGVRGDGVRFEEDLTVMHPRPNAPIELQMSLSTQFSRTSDPLILHMNATDPSDLQSLAHRVRERLRAPSVASVGVSNTFGLASLLPNPPTVRTLQPMLRALDADRIIADFESAVDDSPFNPEAYRDYVKFLRDFLTKSSPPNLDTLLAYPAIARALLPRDAINAAVAATEAITLVQLDQPLANRTERDAAIAAIRDALGDEPGVTLTGLPVIAHDTERVIRTDLVRLVKIAIGVVLLWLVVYFKSLSATIIALLPAIFGLMCLVGFMGQTDLRLNMINMIGVPLLVGIGVDDGIFLVSLARAHARGGDGRSSLAAGLSTGCHSVLITTLSTLLTFGTLAFTSTPAIRSLGIMLSVGMVGCLAGSLCLTVPILLLQNRRRSAG